MKTYRITVIVMFLFLLLGRTFADNLTVETVTMSAGDTKQVSIGLKNSDRKYAAFQFDLTLPEGLTIAKNSNGKLQASLNSDRIDDHTLTVTEVGNNTYRFLAFSMSNAEFYGTSGVLLNITLQANTGISGGTRTATLKSQVFTAKNGTQYKWSDATFSIQIQTEAIVVTAKSYTREYGDTNPNFEYTVSGGTINGAPKITCSATKTSSVGTYTIKIEKGSITNSNVTYVEGTLTITKAPLTITAKSYTRKQGESNPTFDVTYSGFKNNETSSVLTRKPTCSTTATSSSSPGTYDITVSGASATNYDISYVNGKLTVTKADAIIVTAKSYTREYGESNPSFGYTTSGGTLNGTPTITCSATKTSPVGTYPIRIAQGSINNYNVTYIEGTLTITKAPLTITAKSYTRKQGESNPTFDVTYSGFKNNETSSVLTRKPTCSTTATSSSAPGTYDITVSGASATNYDISYVNGKLTVTKADAIIVTAKSYTREYGESNPSFGYTTSGGTLNGTPTITCSATKTSPVGTYPIKIAQGSINNYNVTYVEGTLTITKAPLTITAKSYTRKQGESNPTFDVTYSGFKNNETSSVLTRKPTCSTTATSSSAPGTYDITVSGASATNYDIKYVKGTLTITQADAVIVTAKSYTREYGESNPSFGYTTSGGTLNGTPTITCSATKTSPVGTYPIKIAQGSINNYNVTYVEGTLTITKAPLTITAKSYTRKQGESNPTFDVTYSGFKNNETSSVLTRKPTCSTTATSSSAPGTYDITVSGASATNYDISYVNGKLTVTKADAIIVTAKSYTREYGESNPSFGYTTSGGTLNGTPTITCSATKTSPVGTYPIKIAQGSINNYNVTYVEGTLTITKAPLTITAKSYTRKQGESNPTFDVTYSGFKNNETSSVLTRKPTCSTTATSSSAPGTYDITVSGASATNYDIKYVKGTLTITQADAVIVTAKSYKREYGDTNPSFEYTVSGGTISGTPKITCSATKTSSVGTYTIKVEKGSITNSNVKFVDGTLTITKAPLIIMAKSYTRKQGEPNPTFEVTYSGFKNGETSSVLTKKPTCSTTATSSSAPGTYDITVSGASATNYDFSYVKGKLTVTKADAIIVTAKSYTREYGDANPSFGYTTSGGTLNGTPTITCSATKTSPVGTYPIKIAQGSINNYNVTYVEGTLTITKAPLTITAKSYTRKQGESNPTFDVTYSGFKNGETSSVLTRKPTCSTTATSYSSPGTYDITVYGAEAQNYSISYVKGTLTITEKSEVSFTYQGITYIGTTSTLRAEVYSVSSDLINVDIPSTVSYNDRTYQVTSIASGVLSNRTFNYVSLPSTITSISYNTFSNSILGALIWNANTSLLSSVFSYMSMPVGSNFLLYVNSKSYAPTNVSNVIVGSSASSIILTDGTNTRFYCPKAFTAQTISYTHHYGMTTGGNGKGWETIALPFDVQRIEHGSKGVLTPFAQYSDMMTQRPFWLYELDSNGFRKTDGIKSNTPYIIAMPNDSKYDSDYILAGDVTFSATNATVAKTESLTKPTSNGKTFVPAFAVVNSQSSVYVLNVHNNLVSNYSSYDAGSRFISNLRSVYPFEAYMTTSSYAARALSIEFEDGTTGIDEIPSTDNDVKRSKVYSLGGQLLIDSEQSDWESLWQQLPAGVYIVNGKKVIRK